MPLIRQFNSGTDIPVLPSFAVLVASLGAGIWYRGDEVSGNLLNQGVSGPVDLVPTDSPVVNYQEPGIGIDSEGVTGAIDFRANPVNGRFQKTINPWGLDGSGTFIIFYKDVLTDLGAYIAMGERTGGSLELNFRTGFSAPMPSFGFQARTGPATSTQTRTGGQMGVGKFNMIAVVQDGISTSVLTPVYINGKLDTSRTNDFTGTQRNDYWFFDIGIGSPYTAAIGDAVGTGNIPFKGIKDEVIYFPNIVLTAANIRDIFFTAWGITSHPVSPAVTFQAQLDIHAPTVEFKLGEVSGNALNTGSGSMASLPLQGTLAERQIWPLDFWGGDGGALFNAVGAFANSSLIDLTSAAGFSNASVGTMVLAFVADDTIDGAGFTFVIFGSGSDAAGFTNLIQFGITDAHAGTPEFFAFVRTNGAANEITWTAGEVIQAFTPYLVVLVQGASGLRIYINGVAQTVTIESQPGTGADTDWFVEANALDVNGWASIGAFKAVGAGTLFNQFSGVVDTIAHIDSVELSPAQILTLYDKWNSSYDQAVA